MARAEAQPPGGAVRSPEIRSSALSTAARVPTDAARRLTAALEPVTSSFELVFVDDREPGRRVADVDELAERDPRVRLVRLSRNFGQHAAITAGLAQAGSLDGRDGLRSAGSARGDPAALREGAEGYDIVFARRRSGTTSLFRRAPAQRSTSGS